MAIVEVSIIPLGTKTSSLSNYIAQVIEVLQNESSIKYELTGMGTILEGDLGHILDVVQQMHETVFSDEINRVFTLIKIDDRRDKTATKNGKVESVKKKLQ